MKKIKLSVLFIFILSMAAQAQFTPDQINPTPSNDFSSQMKRTGATGFGFYPGTNLPTSLLQARAIPGQLFNNFQISQVESGNFGLFGSDDKWIGIGVGNPSAPVNPYGLAISDQKNFAFFNLLQENTTKNLLTVFSVGDPSDPNKFILRSLEDVSGVGSRDLMTATPFGAIGVNESPLSTFWVNSKLTDPSSSLQRSIAIVGEQRLAVLPSGSTTQSSASAIGNQANSSLATAGIPVEGFRAQIPDFLEVLPPNPLTGIATNLQVVKSPFGGPNYPFVSTQSPTNFEYAELTWQDLDFAGAAAVDCNILPVNVAQGIDKFFISFRNNQNTNPFATGNKLPIMTFQANGRVGIGTTQPTSGISTCTNPAPKPVLLDVNGNIVVGGTLINSDRRFKKDIEPILNSMDIIRQIEGTTYSFRHDEFPERNFSGGKQYGFIAQELEKVIPEMTLLNSDGYYAVDYTMLIPVLTESIKEQDAIVTEQQAQIAQLESEVQELRNMMQSLQSVGSFDTNAKGYSLEQNRPNPFGSATQINYNLPDGTTGASINVYDLNGRLLKSYPVSGTSGSVEIDGSDFAGGIYIYDLLVNGKQMDVKRMVLNKLD